MPDERDAQSNEIREENSGPSPLDSFDELGKDTIKEIGNISLGSSATILSQLTSRRVDITTPKLSCTTVDKLKASFPAPCIMVEVEYVEGITGKNLLIINKKDAVIIGQLMMMQEPEGGEELSEIHLSALSEAMNQMMGASATSMSEMFKRMINISTPRVEYKEFDTAVEENNILEPGEDYIQVSFNIVIEGLVDSEILQLMPVDFAKKTAQYLIEEYRGDTTTPEVISIPEESPLDCFDDMEKDTIKEIGNISLGSSATILSQLISRQVNITTPSLSCTTVAKLKSSFPAPCIMVDVEYIEGLHGKNLLIINKRDAVIIGQLMMMEEPEGEGELTEIHLSALSEAMNQMMGAAATSMSDMFERMINISPPRVEYKEFDEAVEEDNLLAPEEVYIQVSFRIEIEDLVDSEILQLMPIDFAKETVKYLLERYQDEETSAPQGDYGDSQSDSSSIPQAGQTQEPGVGREGSVSSPLFESIVDVPGIEPGEELDLVKNITLDVQGIVGRVRMPLVDVLNITRGSIIEFDSEVGDLVDILVNGKLVAQAEIVAVDEYYGLKLREIVRE